MATSTNSLAGITSRLRQWASAAPAGLPDRDLLGRYVGSRDEAAFSGLVQRHGPMVLGICRKMLRHAQDAEDAFQATFLVLARKASAIRKQESVGGWLYGVAYRVANKLRLAQSRRRARETPVVVGSSAEKSVADDLSWREVHLAVCAE